MSDRETLRVQVAECCRLLEHLQLIDFSGHVSARLPGTDRVLINPWGASRNKLTPDDIVEIDLDGNLLQGDSPPPSETPIHTSIYRARPDVLAVAHIHPPLTTALFLSGRPFRPVIYHGSIFADGVPVYDDSRHVNTRERGDALAAALGEKARAVIIRGHGAAVATESVMSCFFACVYLEDNCHKLLLAYQAGGEPRALPPEEMEEGRRGIWREAQFTKIWNYYKEKSGLRF